MSNLESWRNISTKLVQKLSLLSIKPIELCLVGSQVKEYKPESDFDSILIIDFEFEDEKLIEVRCLLDEMLDSDSLSEVYHYKLFNRTHFEQFSKYDGFRLADFQKHNYALLKTNYLNIHKPLLDETNFINSILIQTVYRYINALPSNSISEYFPIISKWINTNLSYNHNLHIDSKDKELKYFREKDQLFSIFFDSFISTDVIDSQKLNQFLSSYYKRIPHELINKSRKYSKTITQTL